MRRKALAYAALVVTVGGVNYQTVLAQPGFYDLAANDQTNAAIRLRHQRTDALATYQSKDFDEAINRWKLIIAKGSNEAYDHYWLGQSYYHLQRYEEAASAFKEAFKLDKKMDQAKVKLVESYLACHNLAEARNACADVLPTVSDPYAKKQLESMSQYAHGKSVQLTVKSDNTVESPCPGRR
jgi:TolA-binding protein